MFSEQSTSQIDLSERKAHHVFVSRNSTRMAYAEDEPAEVCKAWCFVLEVPGEESFSIHVGLLFIDSQRLKLFSSETGFLSSKTPENLVMAEAFAGDMGFYFEDLRYASSSAQDQAEIERLTPFFHSDLESYFQSLSEDEKMVLKQNFETTQIRAQSLDKYEYFLEQYVTILSML